MTEATLRLVAVAAHECWREQLAAEGWRHGAAYSAEDRVHDALIPFDLLGKADQRRTLRALRCEDVGSFLAGLLNYPRCEDRELQPEDMAAGRLVELVPDLRGTTPPRGRISSWVVNAQSGDLDLIRVRWDDGAETEHTASEREIRLVDPDAAGS